MIFRFDTVIPSDSINKCIFVEAVRSVQLIRASRTWCFLALPTSLWKALCAVYSDTSKWSTGPEGIISRIDVEVSYKTKRSGDDWSISVMGTDDL